MDGAGQLVSRETLIGGEVARTPAHSNEAPSIHLMLWISQVETGKKSEFNLCLGHKKQERCVAGHQFVASMTSIAFWIVLDHRKETTRLPTRIFLSLYSFRPREVHSTDER